MIPPFALHIECDDAALARAIGKALASPLGRRGARVRIDGVAQGPEQASRFSVSIETTPRGAAGAACTIGLADIEGTRWVAPLELSEEPLAASDEIIGYLERWGFLGTGRTSSFALA